MKKTIKVSAIILALVVGLLATGCSGSSPENRTITLVDISWDESIAVANLTKVQKTPDKVIPAYGLKQELVESSTPGMHALRGRYSL